MIAFARTIATNPKILILDEATANIDSETEEQIQQSLNTMRKGRTTLAIAHRLSTIQDADKILVLNHGEIVEQGTHETLIKKMVFIIICMHYKMVKLSILNKINEVWKLTLLQNLNETKQSKAKIKGVQSKNY